MIPVMDLTKISLQFMLFFKRFSSVPGITEELDFAGFKPEDLQVTTTGQLSTSIGGDLAFNINEKEAAEIT